MIVYRLTCKAGGYETDYAAHHKRSESHCCNGGATMWCHSTERSDKDAQGTGIGKAADGECGDSSAAGLQKSTSNVSFQMSYGFHTIYNLQ